MHDAIPVRKGRQESILNPHSIWRLRRDPRPSNRSANDEQQQECADNGAG